MLSRSLGILIATWLPCLALMLPLSPFHTVNAIIAGLVASVLAAFSLAYERARVGAAIIGVPSVRVLRQGSTDDHELRVAA
jgi:hypothetical protein